MRDPRFSRRRFVQLATLLGAGSPVITAQPAGGAGVHAVVRRVRDPKHFVLVHGAWHGAWCWYKIVAALELAGHRVTAPDMPSAGIDQTPPAPVTLQEQTDRVIGLLDDLSEPVILVGHSAGGAVISTVAEARPAKVEKLVYLTAVLLETGDSVAAAGLRDPESHLTAALVVTPDGALEIARPARRDVFYGDCDDQDVALAQALLKPLGVRTTIDPVVVGDNFARVRRFYVSCSHDRAISPALQRTMYETLPCEKVLSIPSDHSPFLSHPAALVRTLARIARA